MKGQKLDLYTYLVGPRAYSMKKAALFGIIEQTWDMYKDKIAIFCVVKNKVAIAKKDIFQSSDLMDAAILDYKKNGFNVYHTNMPRNEITYEKNR